MKDETSVFGAKPERLDRLVFEALQDSEPEEVVQTASLGAVLERPGGQIGRYKLLSILGEGGMGVVYLAEQEEPIKRRVALKVIKPGMDSKRVIARFEAERQALALLDHPNIAHVYDAGTTETGRPYFVMEYVRGLPITEYCDHHTLTIKERLRLFQQVCHAVQHAHQKGIIHRDIKPSNILVSSENDQAIPKIIDFGVAKAIAQPLTERTLFTEDSQLLGTPEYMSPEQADMASEDIDTRSDIYSLGVLLYVLLTGVLPFDSDTLRTGGIDHIRQIIRETDPKTPSTRLSKLGEEAKKVAENRRTEVATLAKKLHKELEWIPLKAMRKKRSQRYRSASELADDIENYLKGAPLMAGPLTAGYRLQKFLRRHKAIVGGIAAVLFVSVIGTIVSMIFAMGQANALARQASALAQNKAMAEFLKKDILEPFAAESFKPVDVRAVFDTAAEKIENRFADYPLLEASMRFTFGNIYWNLFGDYDVAVRNLERALVLQRREPEGEAYLTMNYLGLAYVRAGKYREAEAMFRDLVRSIEKSHEEQATKPGPLYYAAKSHLGNTWRLLGRYDEVEPYLREAILHPWWDKGHWREQLYVGRIAHLLRDRGFYDEAEQIYDNLLRTSQSSQTPQYLSTMTDLGLLHILQGRLNDAEPLLEKALAGYRKELGDEHPLTAGIKTALAVLRMKEGNHAEAELLFEAALRNMQGRTHDDHPELLATRSYFGVLLREQHRYEEAEKLLSEVLQGQSEKLGPDHPKTLKTMYELALLYNEKGDYDKAEPLLIQAIGGQRLKLGDKHPHTLESINNLIALYEAWSKPEKATQWQVIQRQ